MSDNIQPDKFLLPEDDGLPMRDSHYYAHYKLDELSVYLALTTKTMTNKWRHIYYIDLQAGPGKNWIGNEVVLGSPLLALTLEQPFTAYRLNELRPKLNSALQQRTNVSPYADRVKVYQGDANDIVSEIVYEIMDVNRHSLSVAFLDPQGLELKWSSVVQLAKLDRMDLIINLCTNGLKRSIAKGYLDPVHELFGTSSWQEKYPYAGSPTEKNRYLIDFYQKQLQSLGYLQIETNPQSFGGTDVAIKNSRGAQVYSLITAGKHRLANKFGQIAKKQAQPQKKFPGF